MKFSLKLLLAITLLAALSINGLNTRYQSSVILNECKLLEEAIETERRTTAYFAEKKLIYARATEAFERRKEKLSAADDFFEPVIRAHGKLDIEDPTKIHVFSVSGHSGDEYNRIHERYRIWIPNTSEFVLSLGFHHTNVLPTEWPEFRDSYYFKPNKQLTHALKPGLTLVELKVRENDRNNTNTVEVMIDGVDAHTAKRNGVLSSSEFMMGIVRTSRQSYADVKAPRMKINDKPVRAAPFVSISHGESEKVFPADFVELATAEFWPTEEEPESFSLVIRPIESEDKHGK